jgi:hypothetical protein
MTANAGIHISLAVNVGIGADARGEGSVRLEVVTLAADEVPASQRRVVDKTGDIRCPHTFRDFHSLLNHGLRKHCRLRTS